MAKVDLTRIPSHYHRYVERIQNEELNEAFKSHENDLLKVLQKLPVEKWDYRYAEGKWSVKELVQHLIDSERIFCYRALCIARKEKASLPGFDENAYAIASKADQRSKDELMNELAIVQKGSTLLFQSFSNEQLEEEGIANKNKVYVKGIGFILIGHVLHHLSILNERYI